MIIALALTCGSCVPLSVGEPYFAQAVPLCSVLSAQPKYAGQHVLVRGLYVTTPHQGLIYGPECDRFVPLIGSHDVPDDKRVAGLVHTIFLRDEFARVPVVVSGVFQPMERVENGERVIRFSETIEEAAFVAARQPPVGRTLDGH